MAADHTRRFTLDLTACSDRDIADKLIDLANDFDAGNPPSEAVFASPSCSGIARTSDITDDSEIGSERGKG